MNPRTAQGRFVWTFGILGVVLVITALINLATFVFQPASPTVWAPLGPYPTQPVADVTDTAVIVDATRCASVSQVRVMSSVSWHRLRPPGAEYGAGTGMSTLTFPAGCRTTRFVNTIPAAVRALDLPGARWVIVGVDTPITEAGVAGQQIAWQTEPFVLTQGTR